MLLRHNVSRVSSEYFSRCIFKRRNPPMTQSARVNQKLATIGKIRTVRPDPTILGLGLTYGFLIFVVIYRNLSPTRIPNAKRT